MNSREVAKRNVSPYNLSWTRQSLTIIVFVTCLERTKDRVKTIRKTIKKNIVSTNTFWSIPVFKPLTTTGSAPCILCVHTRVHTTFCMFVVVFVRTTPMCNVRKCIYGSFKFKTVYYKIQLIKSGIIKKICFN